MLSFFDRYGPLFGLPIYWLVATGNPLIAGALFNCYLFFWLISVLLKITKINSVSKHQQAKVNTAAWVGTIVVMLTAVWGVVKFSNLYILAAAVIIGMCIENIRKRKLDKE